jgi:transcriptional regulator GlxA family with amidase domain
LSPAQQAGYQALFTRLMAEGLYPQRAGHEAALAAWLRLILVTASRWGEDVPQDPPAVAADPELANLWEILAEHVEAPEADLAAALARRVPNYDSLRHRFKRVYGRAPRDLVACMRLERAKHLLLETDLQIGEVAERLGYGRPAEFTRAFTRAVGSSPGAFRRQPGS